MKKLKVAIIGQGRSGRNIHGDYFHAEDNVNYEVAAVVELADDRRARAAQEWPGAQICADYRELFGRTDLDLVVNASFSRDHYPVTKELLKHGFNVLVEKPMARHYHEAVDLIRTAEENGVRLAVFQQTFLAPYYLDTRKILASGKLGQVLQVDIAFNGYARRWDWQTLLCEGAGGAYNTGPHPFGLALDFLDYDPNWQLAFSRLGTAFTSGDGDDYAKAILTAPGKPVVDVEICSNDCFSKHKIRILGTRGCYECDLKHYKMKYWTDEENEPRPVQRETLRNAEGLPMYCGEKLVTHEEEGDFSGSPFDRAVATFYDGLYATLTAGAPLPVPNEKPAQIIRLIEMMHTNTPLPVKF